MYLVKLFWCASPLAVLFITWTLLSLLIPTDPYTWAALQKRFDRTPNDAIEDIYDGEGCRKHTAAITPGEYLAYA